MGKIFEALEKSKTAQKDSDLKDISRTNKIEGVHKTPEINRSAEKKKQYDIKNRRPVFKIEGGQKGSNGINEKASLEKEAGPVTIGETRKIAVKEVDKNLITLLNPQSFESEQFKMLKTNLLFPASGIPPRSIMITSTLPNEGKSFVASNLAVSIAQNIDEHVLLVDCDMRLPTIHKIFGFGDVPGLSDYLSKGIPLSSLLHKTNVNKLTILPGGKPPHNPSELLSSENMSTLLEEVKARYPDRYTIIDTAPPQLTAEGSALARQVDAIILVVNYGYTRRDLIADLVENLGRDKILGVIVNRFDMNSSLYYGYRKYGRHSKYYR